MWDPGATLQTLRWCSPAYLYITGTLTVLLLVNSTYNCAKGHATLHTNYAAMYSSTPISILGTMLLFHPFAAAIPAAVVGPPTLALDAKRSVRLGQRWPTHKIIPKCTNTCTKAKINNAGAERTTWLMLPLAPTDAKNICTCKRVCYISNLIATPPPTRTKSQAVHGNTSSNRETATMKTSAGAST